MLTHSTLLTASHRLQASTVLAGCLCPRTADFSRALTLTLSYNRSPQEIAQALAAKGVPLEFDEVMASGVYDPNSVPVRRTAASVRASPAPASTHVCAHAR